MWQTAWFEQPIAGMLICSDQLHVVANGFTNEAIQCWSIRVLDNLTGNVSLPADCTDNANLAALLSAANMGLFVGVPVPVFAADEGFVHFDDTHQFLKLFIIHRGTNARAHIPDRFVAGLIVEHGTLNLERTHSFLGMQHQETDREPSLEWILGILEYRAGNQRESIAFLCALMTLPVPRPVRERVDLGAIRIAGT